MANRNTNPGIGKNVDSGVINNPQPSRARTHARVVRPTGILKEPTGILKEPTGILKESLLPTRRARTRTRGERRFHRMASENLYTEKFQPCRGGEMQKHVDVFCRKERKVGSSTNSHKSPQIRFVQMCADLWSLF